MNIAIIGAHGQLGTELCHQLGPMALPLARTDLDLTDVDTVRRILRELRPTAVVNVASYTSVDRAEEEAELCFRVNAEAVGLLADICRELDAPLVQVSSDYVFGADRNRTTPYRETDKTGPQGVYAKSKLAGEKNAATWKKHFIVRSCGLYATSTAAPVVGKNFVDSMLVLGGQRDKLQIVNDQVCTPTYVPHLVHAIVYLMETGAFGLYHITNSGETTWFDFSQEIFRLAGIQIELEPITTEQYNAAAPRPRYSVLDTSKYHALNGPIMPAWQQALAERCRLGV